MGARAYMKLTARAKINLTLNVLRRRANGYHDLELIFQPVSLADELFVEENESGDLHFTCSVPEFANPQNLVCRGYETLRQMFPEKIRGLSIHLEKHIPSGAGMAGGSTDCSALLLWMNDHFQLGMTMQQLIDVGVTLGADVPACMMTHATIGRGVGEKLTDISIPITYPLLLLKPDMSFPTGEMFRVLDEAGYEDQKNTNEEMIRAMEAGDLPAMAAALYNVFEEAVPERARIQELKTMLLEAGALGSLMTGSGSVVYGIFENKEIRDQAEKKLRESSGCQVFACEAVNEW